MNEKILYEDKNVTITNRKFATAQNTIYLAAIQKLRLQQIRDSSSMNRTLIYGFAWGLLCILLNFTPIPTVIIFVSAVAGIWWLGSRAWPYVIVANTQNGEQVIFSSHNQKYIEKITLILCERLGFELPPLNTIIKNG